MIVPSTVPFLDWHLPACFLFLVGCVQVLAGGVYPGCKHACLLFAELILWSCWHDYWPCESTHAIAAVLCCGSLQVNYPTLALCLWPPENMEHMPPAPQPTTVKGIEPQTVYFPDELADEAGAAGDPAAEQDGLAVSDGEWGLLRARQSTTPAAAGPERRQLEVNGDAGLLEEGAFGSVGGAESVGGMESHGHDSIGAVPWFADSASDSDSSSSNGEDHGDGMDADGADADELRDGVHSRVSTTGGSITFFVLNND